MVMVTTENGGDWCGEASENVCENGTNSIEHRDCCQYNTAVQYTHVQQNTIMMIRAIDRERGGVGARAVEGGRGGGGFLK